MHFFLPCPNKFYKMWLSIYNYGRFVDVLQTLGHSVAYLGKRSDIALDLSNQLWHNSDKEVRSFNPGCIS